MGQPHTLLDQSQVLLPPAHAGAPAAFRMPLLYHSYPDNIIDSIQLGNDIIICR